VCWTALTRKLPRRAAGLNHNPTTAIACGEVLPLAPAQQGQAFDDNAVNVFFET